MSENLRRIQLSGELTQLELILAKEQFIKTVKLECFPQEIRTLEDKRRLSSNSGSLKIAPKIDGGLVRSNTRLCYPDDLPEETFSKSSFQRNNIEIGKMT